MAQHSERSPHSSHNPEEQLQGLQRRLPPQNIEAEKAVLGSILLYNESLHQVLTEIQAPDFYAERHRLIYSAMLELEQVGNPIDTISLANYLGIENQLEKAGGIAYLSELADHIPSVANILYYVRIVREKAIVRRLIEVGMEIVSEAYDDVEDVMSFLDTAERKIFDIRQDRATNELTPVKSVISDAFATIETLYHRKERITGVPTGFEDFDRMTCGLQPSDLIIIAARPSMGKCLSADSEITLADGSIATIEEIYHRRHAKLFTLRPDRTFGFTQPCGFLDDGIKPVFRVTTKLGRRVNTTLSHPFLTALGWQSLSQLHIGQKIAVPRKLEIFGKISAQPPQIDVIADAMNVRESDMRLPEYVFRWDRPSLVQLLQRIFSCDVKSSTAHNACMYFQYAAIGETIARQMLHLLLRFGILAELKICSQDIKGSPSWILEITEPQSLELFDAQILNPRPDITTQNLPDAQTHCEQIYWDEIVSIEALGEQQVYDLCIPETHNFVANDICVHNTALVLNMTTNAALYHKKSVALFSLEMSKEQLVMRMLCSVARVDATRMRTGHMKEGDIPRLTQAATELAQSRIFIDDTGDLSSLEMRAKCRRLKMECGDLGLVIVDYLQLMSSDANLGSREREIAEISRGLKALAKELSVPVIALSQLNRSLERRPDKRPVMSDLRESGSIEQDADLIAFIYRDEVYNEDTEDKGIAELIIGKQRNGPIGTVRMRFFHEYTRFDNLAPEDSNFY
jgi:replicative DNA helicase